MTESIETSDTTEQQKQDAAQIAKSFLPDKLYDALKWASILLLPAVSTAVATVGNALGWQASNTAAVIITAIGTLIGGILGYASLQYKQTDES